MRQPNMFRDGRKGQRRSPASAQHSKAESTKGSLGQDPDLYDLCRASSSALIAASDLIFWTCVALESNTS